MNSPPNQIRRRAGGWIVRALLTLVAVGVATLTIDAAPAMAQLPPGDGYSAINGQIGRTEVMKRAQDWYNHRWDSDLTYDQPNDGVVLPFHWDFNQTRKYRRDCSGYVDMAWHLGSDYYTGNLAQVAIQLSSKSQLQPGDMLLDAAAHVIIFKAWVNSTTFTYYAFGSTPIIIGQETLTGGSDGLIDSHPASAYLPYKYKNII